MNRRLWGTVGMVVLALAAVSVITATPAQWHAAVAAAASFASAVERAGRLMPISVGLAVIAVALTLPLAATMIVRRRRRPRAGFGEPWRTVLQMGHQGRSPSAIAQATGIPQDAVRIVLSPVAVDPSLSRGKSFRSIPPNDPSTRGPDNLGGQR